MFSAKNPRVMARNSMKNSKISLISLIPEHIPLNLSSLSNNQFMAWLRLFGEIPLEDKLIDIGCLFLECSKEDESIVILQFGVLLQSKRVHN